MPTTRICTCVLAVGALWPSQLLILVDLCGTLVFKTKTGSREREYATLSRRRHPDFEHRFNSFWVRPGARELLAELTNDPRIQPAVYTSMLDKNVYPIVMSLDASEARGGPWRTPVKVAGGSRSVSTHTSLAPVAQDWLFDQGFNAPDLEESTPSRPAFKRDLGRVWRHPRVRREGYGAHNTLLIEPDLSKARDWRSNTISALPYTADDVLTDGTRARASLDELRDYLENYILPGMQRDSAEGNRADVRTLLASVTFQQWRTDEGGVRTSGGHGLDSLGTLLDALPVETEETEEGGDSDGGDSDGGGGTGSADPAGAGAGAGGGGEPLPVPHTGTDRPRAADVSAAATEAKAGVL